MEWEFQSYLTPLISPLLYVPCLGFSIPVGTHLEPPHHGNWGEHGSSSWETLPSISAFLLLLPPVVPTFFDSVPSFELSWFCRLGRFGRLGWHQSKPDPRYFEFPPTIMIIKIKLKLESFDNLEKRTTGIILAFSLMAEPSKEGTTPLTFDQ